MIFLHLLRDVVLICFHMQSISDTRLSAGQIEKYQMYYSCCCCCYCCCCCSCCCILPPSEDLILFPRQLFEIKMKVFANKQTTNKQTNNLHKALIKCWSMSLIDWLHLFLWVRLLHYILVLDVVWYLERCGEIIKLYFAPKSF